MMARPVYVTGIGMTPFRKKYDMNLSEIAQEAVVAALRDAGFDRNRVEAVYSGSAWGGSLLGQRILRDLGMTGVPLVNIENACSSGSSALHLGWTAVAQGMYDAVLVIGSEKLSRFGSGAIPLEDDDHEVRLGQIMPAVYAMRAQRYFYEYGGTPADLAQVAVRTADMPVSTKMRCSATPSRWKRCWPPVPSRIRLRCSCVVRRRTARRRS